MKFSKSILLLIGLGVILTTNLMAESAASKKASKEINAIRNKMKNMQNEVKDLRGSIRSLEELEQNLATEMAKDELVFKNRMEKTLIPLLYWPKVSLSSKPISWSQREHLREVLMATREHLIREPLMLMSERELRLKNTAQMKADFETKLKSYQDKKQLLGLQLEELKLLKKNDAKNSAKESRPVKPVRSELNY